MHRDDRRIVHLRRIASVAHVFLSMASPAWATDSDAIAAAKEAYDTGLKAYERGDFALAADSFATAERLAPHPSAIWNEARSRHRIGQLATAANLYDAYLRNAPSNAPNRDDATRALVELRQKLAVLDLQAQNIDTIRVDGAPIHVARIFVAPGSHLVSGDGIKVIRVEAAAGTETSVALLPDDHPIEPPRSQPLPPSPPPETPHHGWSPLVVVFESLATVATAGVMTWSCADTVRATHVYDNNKTQANYDAGFAAEHRSNALIGAAAGLGAITVITALFLTDWHHHPKEASSSWLVPRWSFQ